MATVGSNSNKGTVHAQGEGESSAKRQNVTMGLETLDCPICFKPLGPPIYQCSVGHFICLSCRDKLRDKKCYLCSVRTSFKRCFGMEHVVQSVIVPCSNTMHGCAEKVTYYQKEEHEKACPKAPCFCPESGCGFAGPTVALLDHFTTQHKFPSTTFEFRHGVSLRLQPGICVLRCSDNKQFFVLSMASEPFGHAISIICVQPNVTEPKFACDMNYASSCTTGHNISLTLRIRSSSLSDGLPTGYDLILPKGTVSEDGNGILLKSTIKVKIKNGIVRQPIRRRNLEHYEEDDEDPRPRTEFYEEDDEDEFVDDAEEEQEEEEEYEVEDVRPRRTEFYEEDDELVDAEEDEVDDVHEHYEEDDDVDVV